MPLIKTDKAHRELASRQRTLNLKERALLLLADGQKPTADLIRLVQVDVTLVKFLVMQGYLSPAPQQTTRRKMSVDPFDGKRSLATARMFLFDLVERMYVRRDPALAEAFRERLRRAKDRQGMQDVARALLRHIEETAGAERADGISERLAMLMPGEAVA